MELVLVLLGLGMIYSWVHAVVVIFKRLQATGYEKGIVIAGFVTIVIYVVGSLME